MIVITSYSIHYTKLYEFLGGSVVAIGFSTGYHFLIVLVGIIYVIDVITSYSIHYTKLYEVENFGYQSGEIKDADGTVLYRRPAGEELIRWRLLCSSVTLIALLAFLMISISLENWCYAVYSIALAGGCLGFLLWNLHPAKVFRNNFV